MLGTGSQNEALVTKQLCLVVMYRVKEFKLEEFKDALAANKTGYRHHKVVFAPVES